MPGTEPAAEWATAQWRPYQTTVIAMQEQLAVVGAADAVCWSMQSAGDDETLHMAVLVGSALTLGGHLGSQEHFVARMCGDGSGDHHAVWRMLHGTIERTTAAVKKRRKRLVAARGTPGAALRARAALEREKFTGAVGLARHMLRFMQLLCEGHMGAMQELMPAQPGACESYDMITVVCQLIAAVCAAPEALTIALLNQALQFLIETMQVRACATERCLSARMICVCVCVFGGFVRGVV